MSVKTKILNFFAAIGNWFKNHKVAGTCAVVGAVSVVTVAIVLPIVLNNEPEQPVVPPTEVVGQVNEVIKDKMDEVLTQQGTGNEEIFNEDNRDIDVQYVISTEI